MATESALYEIEFELVGAEAELMKAKNVNDYLTKKALDKYKKEMDKINTEFSLGKLCDRVTELKQKQKKLLQQKKKEKATEVHEFKSSHEMVQIS